MNTETLDLFSSVSPAHNKWAANNRGESWSQAGHKGSVGGISFIRRKARVLFCTAFGSIVHRVLYMAVATGFCSGGAVTLLAESSTARTNMVLLSPFALERMDTLISMKPGRSAKDVAATGSMQPVLDENYIVIVEQRRFEDLAFGDIVIFRGDWLKGMPVAHRVIGRYPRGRGWQTKGDHCQGVDPQHLTEDKYKGCVVVAAVHKVTGQVKQFVSGGEEAATIESAIQ